MDTSLHIITAETICEILDQHPTEIYETIKSAYVLHEQNGSISAPSSFLFFPHRPEARIIALPAAIKPNQKDFKEISGMKWIASYPKNKLKNMPRASAIIVINDPETGFPMACMEGSLISATRTALSGVVGAEHLYNKDKVCTSLGIVGTGFIAKHIIKYLLLLGWKLGEIHLYDTVLTSMESFSKYLESLGDFKVITHHDTHSVVKSSELVVFTTTEKTPYLGDVDLFKHKPCILHLSLRDILPDIILDSINIVDDVEYILTANTSVHMAYEKNKKDLSFIKSTIGKVIQKNQGIPKHKTIIYSPMGLGILDLVLSQFIYDRVKKERLQSIDNFFPT